VSQHTLREYVDCAVHCLQPSPAQPSPAQPSPAQPSPAQPSPAQPSPAQSSPVQSSAESEPSRSCTACVGCAALHCAHSVAVSHADDAASVVLRTQRNASERRSSALRSGFVIRRRKEDASKLLGEMVAARWDDITTKADRSAVDLLRKEAPARRRHCGRRQTDRGALRAEGMARANDVRRWHACCMQMDRHDQDLSKLESEIIGIDEYLSRMYQVGHTHSTAQHDRCFDVSRRRSAQHHVSQPWRCALVQCSQGPQCGCVCLLACLCLCGH
jgi:hypothetical protein